MNVCTNYGSNHYKYNTYLILLRMHTRRVDSISFAIFHEFITSTVSNIQIT